MQNIEISSDRKNNKVIENESIEMRMNDFMDLEKG